MWVVEWQESPGGRAGAGSTRVRRLARVHAQLLGHQDRREVARQAPTFLHYFLQRDCKQRLDILDGPIRTGDFARHTRDGESRERLHEGFNTPLFPMVLVANEVMQEGLDLRKHCRRIVHHDLVWNAAQVEQRVGRIDRLGSLTNLLRKAGIEVTLDVLYPVIRGRSTSASSEQ